MILKTRSLFSPSTIVYTILLLFIIPRVMSAMIDTHRSQERSDDESEAANNGTCDTGFEWSIIKPTSAHFGATCCPDGYQAEASFEKGLDLWDLTCCPSAEKHVLCDARLQELPIPPLTCPKSQTLVGVQCQGK